MLNSLFNTLAIKREKNYQIVCERFAESNIDSAEKIAECRAKILDNVKTCVAFSVLVAACLSVLMPALAWFIVLFAFIIISYLIHSAFQGRELAERYLNEVINAPASDSATVSTIETVTSEAIHSKTIPPESKIQ